MTRPCDGSHTSQHLLVRLQGVFQRVHDLLIEDQVIQASQVSYAGGIMHSPNISKKKCCVRDQ